MTKKRKEKEGEGEKEEDKRGMLRTVSNLSGSTHRYHVI